jgi:Protein of unknown function (DUF2844)
MLACKIAVKRSCWGVPLLMLSLSTIASGSLGSNENSIQADRAHIRAFARVTRTATFAIHELQTSSGHVVREYVSPAGTVFGVAWQGPSKPDLRQLLGAYFDPYTQAVDSMERHGHGPLVVRLPNLVVISAGHMGAFSGKAYLPRMLPPGMQPEAIQ